MTTGSPLGKRKTSVARKLPTRSPMTADKINPRIVHDMTRVQLLPCYRFAPALVAASLVVASSFAGACTFASE